MTEDRSRDPWSRTPSVLLRKVIDSLSDGVVVANLEGRCLLSNAAVRPLLGADPAALMVDDWTSSLGCLLPDMRTPVPRQQMPLARALLGEQVANMELFVRNPALPAGVWLSINGGPIRDRSGAIEGGVIVLRDVTAAKLKLQRIELLSSVVVATADVVIVTDRGGQIQYVNPAFEAASGYTRTEVLGRDPSLLKSGAHTREFYSGLWRTLVDGQVFRGTFVNRKKNGELFFTEQTITPIGVPGQGITHMVSVGRDVTQLRRAAERESTLLLARSVQQRLFPSSAPTLPGFDIYGATLAADVTGGDYYDYIPLPGERLGILVADVSGHGFDSALLMAETRAVLRATALTTFEPSAILAVVNQVLHADTEPHRFATLLLVILHVPSGALAYSSAGHTVGHLLDRSGVVKGRLAATGLPLGLFPDSQYETRSLGMDCGDTLVLLTDGVTDCGTPEEELFGTERALDAIRSAAGERSSEGVDTLFRAVKAFEKGGRLRDDVTAVVVKRPIL